jgi:hypothetical protein
METIERAIRDRTRAAIRDEFSTTDVNNFHGIEKRIEERVGEIVRNTASEYFNGFRFKTYRDDARQVDVITVELTPLDSKIF